MSNEDIQRILEKLTKIEAFIAVDQNEHKHFDERISGLHRKISGNGQPGLEQRHIELVTRFDRLEMKIIVWASTAVMLGQIFGPKVLKIIGW